MGITKEKEETAMAERLDGYRALVRFLGQVCPKHWEIVLQDVEAGAILAIENGQVSGRRVGGPLTDHALRIISEGTWRQEPYQTNYEGRTRDGRRLCSSTWFIQEEGNLVGMLCINIDLQQYEAVGRSVLALGGLSPEDLWRCPPSGAPVEQFHSSIPDMTQAAISELAANVPVDRLTQEEKISIVENLEKRGTFLVKGAVSAVAAQLGCSEASIYRYLSMIGKREGRGS